MVRKKHSSSQLIISKNHSSDMEKSDSLSTDECEHTLNESNGGSSPDVQYDVKDVYKSYTANQLKAELRRKGLRTSGRKSTLLNRLSGEMTANGDVVRKRNYDGLIISNNKHVSHDDLNYDDTVYVKDEKFRMENMQSERKNLVLWKRPLITLLYFFKESSIISKSLIHKLMQRKKLVLITLLVLFVLFISTRITGPHQAVILKFCNESKWCLYWLGLGVLSSVGLGTGLHTFLLYLGPHIAAVTISAYECHALNFPEPPYPDQIICPQIIDPSWSVGLWNIMRKVKLESIMWGAGTALGELPPYFMARTARLSGHDPDDEDEELREFEELQLKKKTDPKSMTFMDKLKLSVENIVNRVGFFGILACASVPNPLFDLAGITCGHFLIPFWTFFGATLIGKAIIKMSIQVMFVIVAFDETLIENAIKLVSKIPLLGKSLQAPVNEFLETQKRRLHEGSSAPVRTSILSHIFEVLVTIMVSYFLISIINSMAQHYHKRIYKNKTIKCDDTNLESRDE